jgi:hypothetical protein
VILSKCQQQLDETPDVHRELFCLKFLSKSVDPSRRSLETDRQTDRQTDRKWVPIWRAGGEWTVLIPKLLAIARSLDKMGEKVGFRIIF